MVKKTLFLRQSKTLTSLLFMIPAVIAFRAYLYIYSLVIFSAMISSLLYHLLKERKLYWLDVLTSCTLMGFNLAFLFLAKVSFLPWMMLILFVISALYFWSKAHKQQYNLNHSLWHIASVLITGYCLLCYLVLAGK
jgi:hypothetical protein